MNDLKMNSEIEMKLFCSQITIFKNDDVLWKYYIKTIGFKLHI